jgi:hypothetical protein
MCRELPCSHGLGHGTNPHLCWCTGPRMENQGGIVTFKRTQREQCHHAHAQYKEVSVKCEHYTVQTKNDHVQWMRPQPRPTQPDKVSSVRWKIFAIRLSTYVTHPMSNHQQTISQTIPTNDNEGIGRWWWRQVCILCKYVLNSTIKYIKKSPSVGMVVFGCFIVTSTQLAGAVTRPLFNYTFKNSSLLHWQD